MLQALHPLLAQLMVSKIKQKLVQTQRIFFALKITFVVLLAPVLGVVETPFGINCTAGGGVLPFLCPWLFPPTGGKAGHGSVVVVVRGVVTLADTFWFVLTVVVVVDVETVDEGPCDDTLIGVTTLCRLTVACVVDETGTFSPILDFIVVFAVVATVDGVVDETGASVVLDPPKIFLKPLKNPPLLAVVLGGVVVLVVVLVDFL